MDSHPFAGLVFLGVGIALYFLPSIIARNKRNATAIFILNLLTGWSVLGWVAALIWALTNDAPQVVAFQPTIVAQSLPPLLCSNCGKYSQHGVRFCDNCGQAL